jgi:hypothetical protein
MTIPTGAWQRDWIRRGGGPTDRGVIVRYVQTPSAFGDVRIPADRPDLAHAASLAELSDDQLAELARQSGFAGIATMDGLTATWHHEIDFQPPGGADLGRIEPGGVGRMFEHALDGSYVERWTALGGGGGPFLAVRVAREGRLGQLLVVAGEHFVYARARTVELPAAASIGQLIAQTQPSRERIIGYLDCEISYGRVADWQVEHSTLPWRQGKRLAIADRLAIAGDGRLVPRSAAAGEVWSVSLNTLSPAELGAVFAA